MNVFKNEIELDAGFPFKIEKISLPKADNAKESFHWHSLFEITYIESGKGIYYVSEKNFPVETGDFIIFNHTELHGWEVESKNLNVIVMVFSIDFISERIGNFDYNYLKPFITHGSTFQNKIDHTEPSTVQMASLFFEIYEEWRKQEMGYELMIKANVLKLLTLLLRHFTDDSKPQESLENKRNAMQRLETVFLHLYHHYGEKITLDQMAAECFMSPTYFSTFFKAVTGTTFSHYLAGIRIRQAQKLLKTTDQSIVEIAFDCGFNNLSNFYRTYRRIIGNSPGDERA